MVGSRASLDLRPTPLGPTYCVRDLIQLAKAASHCPMQGHPLALLAMFASALIPYCYLRRRGWL